MKNLVILKSILLVVLFGNTLLAQQHRNESLINVASEIEVTKFINIENATKNGNTIQVYEINAGAKQMIVFYEPTPGMDRYNVIINENGTTTSRYFRVNDTDVTWGYINEPGGPIKAVYYNEDRGEIIIKKKNRNGHRILRPYSLWNNRSKILHYYAYMKKNPMLIRAKESNNFSEKRINTAQRITYGNWNGLIVTNGIKPNTISLLRKSKI